MIRLFNVFVPASVLKLLLYEALLLTACFTLAAYLMLQPDPTLYLLDEGGALQIFFAVISILAGLYFQDLYSNLQVPSREVLLLQLSGVLGMAFLAQAILSYLSRSLRVPLHVMIPGGALAMLAIFLNRVLYSKYGLNPRTGRLLMVGDSPLLDAISRHILDHPEYCLRVVAHVVDDRDPASAGHLGEVVGPLNALLRIARETQPDRIVVGMSERRSRMPMNDLLDLRLSGHIVEEASTTYEQLTGRVSIGTLRPSQLIYSGELGPRPRDVLNQRLWNVALSVVVAVAALPIMLLTAIAVRVSSRGPILYRQVRVGLNGVPFTLYKFRSMKEDAEVEMGAVWASPDDPRVTPVGRFIRILRIDELPQIYNVLRGEMSIVGPRPERPTFVESLSKEIPYYRQRCCIRPGITGWAQINHKYGDTIEDAVIKLEYDLNYIKNMSLGLDTYIIFHTIKAMVTSRGAQ